MLETSHTSLVQVRRDKLLQWQVEGVDPFGTSYPGTLPAQSIIDGFVDGATVRVAGRVMSARPMGKSFFAHLQDDTGRIQIYANVQCLPNLPQLLRLDLGDIMGGEGTCFITKSGEKTVKLTSFQLLSKGLLPLPSDYHGLSDTETRYPPTLFGFDQQPGCNGNVKATKLHYPRNTELHVFSKLHGG